MIGINPIALLKVQLMTKEAIKKYPGTIGQLKEEWPGIIEDIMEIIIRDNEKE